MARTNPTHLPRLLPLMEDELPISFFARLAWANAFHGLGEFCKIMRISQEQLAKLPETHIDQLADWSATSAEALAKFALPPGRIPSFGATRVKLYEMTVKGLRYCPNCIAKDLERRGFGYIRAPWQWEMISCCPIHGCGFEISPDRVNHTAGFTDLAAMKDEVLDNPERGVSRYLYDRIVGNPTDVPLLDNLEGYVAVEMCSMLGHFKNRAEEVVRDHVAIRRVGSPTVRQNGFALACSGAEAVSSFLSGYVASAMEAYRPRNVYSPLEGMVRRNQDDPAFDPLKQFFQEHAEENIALEPGEIFFWPVKERKVHTLRSAANEYNIPEERVERILRTELAVEKLPYYFKVAEIDEILKREKDYLLTSEAAAFIGISVQGLDKLLAEGLLPFRNLGDVNLRAFRYIHRRDLEKLRDSIMTHVDPHIDLSSLSPATNFKLLHVIRLIQAGKLRRVGHSNLPFSLQELYIDNKEFWKARSAMPEFRTTRGRPRKPLIF